MSDPISRLLDNDARVPASKEEMDASLDRIIRILNEPFPEPPEKPIECDFCDDTGRREQGSSSWPCPHCKRHGDKIRGTDVAKKKNDAMPPFQYLHSGRRMTRCQADDDDHCDYKDCPQHRDGEPGKSGRHCPLDTGENIREMED